MFHFSGTKTTLETMFCYGGRFTGDGHSGSHGRNCNFVGCGDMLQRTTLAGKPLLLPVLFKLAATAETTAKTAATAMQAATRRLTLQAMFRTALTAMPPQRSAARTSTQLCPCRTSANAGENVDGNAHNNADDDKTA